MPKNDLETLETTQNDEKDEAIDDPAKWEMNYERCPHCGTKCLILEVFMPKRMGNKPENVVKVNRKKEYDNSS